MFLKTTEKKTKEKQNEKKTNHPQQQKVFLTRLQTQRRNHLTKHFCTITNTEK